MYIQENKLTSFVYNTYDCPYAIQRHTADFRRPGARFPKVPKSNLGKLFTCVWLRKNLRDSPNLQTFL